MKKLVRFVLVLSLIAYSATAVTLWATTADCSEDPNATVCCEYWSDSTPTVVNGQSVCAWYGTGCWECVDRNEGTSCVSAEECEPSGDLRFFVPTV